MSYQTITSGGTSENSKVGGEAVAGGNSSRPTGFFHFHRPLTPPGPEEDISTLVAIGHFYFGLTEGEFSLDFLSRREYLQPIVFLLSSINFIT